MMLFHELIYRYGALIVFLSVFVSSLGLPFPSITALVMLGASITTARYDLTLILLHFVILLLAAVSGGVLGDLIWFHGGKRYGRGALQLVCKLSFTKASSVERFDNFFARHAARVLVIARFVPGLSLIVVPLCGVMAIKTRSFILQDCAGVSLWACTGLLGGALFGGRIDTLIAQLRRSAWHVPLLGMGLIVLVFCAWLACRAHKPTPVTGDSSGMSSVPPPLQVIFDRRRHAFRRTTHGIRQQSTNPTHLI